MYFVEIMFVVLLVHTHTVAWPVVLRRPPPHTPRDVAREGRGEEAGVAEERTVGEGPQELLEEEGGRGRVRGEGHLSMSWW